MAMECCENIFKRNIKVSNNRELPLWDDSYVSMPTDDNILISHNWAELRKIMWNYVGILRSDKMLTYARDRLEVIHSEINEFYHTHHINMDLLELRNLIDVANVITTSALERKESRGLHFNKDYPYMDKRYNQSTKLINNDEDFIMRLVTKV